MSWLLMIIEYVMLHAAFYCVYRDCYGLSPLKTVYKDFVYFHFQFEVDFTLMISRRQK